MDKLDKSQSITAIFGQLANEVQFLAADIHSIERAIGKMLEHPNNAGSLPLFELQKLDLIGQVLRDLKLYFDQCSLQSPADWVLNLESFSEPLYLRDLSDRLTNLGSPKRANNPADETGDIVLF